MIARSIVRLVATTLLLALAWAGTPNVRAADEEKPAATEKKASPEGKAKKSPADYRGPVPPLYAKILSPSQKEKVYTIQSKYDEQLKPLMAKIKELQSEREKEIDALLSPEQLKELEAIRAESQTKKVKKPTEGDAAPKKSEAGK